MKLQCRRRLLRLCEADLDAETLRREVVEELRRAIGFAAWGWPLADPDSLLPTSGIADCAMWPIVAHLVRYEERSMDLNKDRDLATRGDPVGALSLATRGELDRSSRWRDILGPYGFADELRAACVDRYGCWGHLRLYRDSGDRAFDVTDADLLRQSVPGIASALRRAAVRAIPVQLQQSVAPGIVILDEQLAVRSWTRQAEPWFEAFAGDQSPHGFNAKCAVFSAGARCLANEATGSGPPASTRVRLPDGRWVVAEAARLQGYHRGVAVTVRAATSSDVLDLLVRAHGLTPRERMLVAELAEGLGTREVARRMSISVYTVQQHLKAIFNKVGVRSRRELVTGVLAGRS